MVYTSLPAYIDPANWQQQQPNHQGGNTGVTSPLLHPTLPSPLPASSQPHGGSIRPGSMADRARMANMPMQEAQQKCPRCESTNTKFCYFNNYSLSQPRHFCKTCRRYWTRGGALRNVPVGGGFRRNKRNKSTNTSATSKSPASSDRQTGSSSAIDIAGLGPTAPPTMRFMAPLHQLSDQHHHIGEIGLNYGLIGGVGELNLNTSFGGGCNSLLSSVGLEQWRVPQTHQFPFLSGLEASSSHGLLYPFEGGSSNSTTTSGVISQLASVKMEDNNNNNNNHEIGLSRQFLGINNPTSDQQYWTNASGGGGTSAWTDLSAFSSSSATTNPLYRREELN